MNSSRTSRISLHRRILLVFLISIALPGFYVSYIGVRSIIQEQELQQGLLVQNVGRALTFEIARAEQRLEDSAQQYARRFCAYEPSHTPPTIKREGERPFWIEQAFAFDERLRLRSPLPFQADRPALHASALIEISLQSRADSAQQLEVRGDYTGALAAYQQLLAESRALPTTVVLNTYRARCAAAIGNREAAREAHKAVIATDSTFSISQPIPYAAFAWLEIVKEQLVQGRMRDAMQSSVRFHQRLLDNYHHFSSEQYEYFSRKLQSLRASISVESYLGDALLTSIDSVDERERRLHASFDRARQIASWLHMHRPVPSVQNPTVTLSHHSLPTGEGSLPLSLIWIAAPPDLRRWVVLVLRPEIVQQEFIVSALQSSELADGFTITLLPNAASEFTQKALVSAPMRKTSSLFPSCVASVSAKHSSTIEILGIQTSILAVGLALLVGGVILLGIVIMYHDIRREEDISRMKSDFISNVSHELKTPIAAIRMLADNLRHRRVPGETKQFEYYQLISKESARLSHLIDNILDFSRIEGKRKTFQLEPREISGIVSETVRQFTSMMEDNAQTISLVLEENVPSVQADADSLSLALFNLLDNAVKYSDKESRIAVTMSKEGGSLCIAVSDHGVGIPKEDREKIFEKFYRVQRADGRKVPGSGIGLTLVKEIAEAHNASIEIKSEIGAGSTFRMLFPIGG